MGVLANDEMPAKALHPILWRPEEIHLLLMFFFVILLMVATMLFFSHVPTVLRGSAPIEYGGIIAAVKIHVRLGEIMFCKYPAAIAKQYLEEIVSFSPVAPFSHPRLQQGRRAKANCQQQQKR